MNSKGLAVEHVSAPPIRLPEVHPIGFSLPHGLMNVVLSKVRPCDEASVINRINRILSDYRDALRAIEMRRPSSSAVDGNGRNGSARDVDTTSDASLAFHPVHATLMGNYHLATLFRSSGFSQCQVFGTIDQILCQQVILGDIPVPLEGGPPLDFLWQSYPDEFLSPYKSDDVPAHVLEMPLLTVCQLEVSGLTRSASAANIVLPLLHAINNCLADVAKRKEAEGSEHGRRQEPIRGLLLGSFGWSDYTLLLRGSNIDTALECIDALRRLRLRDLKTTWRDIGQRVNMTAPLYNVTHSQLEAFNRRLDRLKADFCPEGISEDGTFFSASTTIPGVLWPIADWNVRAETGNLPPQQSKKIQISGSVGAHVLIAIPTGHEQRVQETLDETIQRWTGTGLSSSCHGQSLGRFDRTVSAVDFCPPSDPCARAVDLSILIRRYYYLRWRLAGEPGGVDSPWLDEKSRHGKCQYIRDMELYIGGVFLQTNAPTAQAGQNFTLEWEEFVYSGFGGGDMSLKMVEYVREMKKRGISRSLRSCFLQVVSLWRREMGDALESVPMIELCDAFLTWINAICQALKDKTSTTGQIEDLIRFFTEPFGQAVLQRTLTGYRLSDRADSSTDFKGGLSRLVTGVDGLVKAAMSVVGPPFQAGCLTLIGQGRAATTNIERVSLPQDSDSSIAQQYLCSIITINYPHVAHPLGIATVLHELLHVVVSSGDFRNALKEAGASRLFFEAINGKRGSGPDTLAGLRIEEMLVEYILAWLLFHDNPNLYARTTLVQQVLHPELRAHTHDENCWLLTEHFARAFIVSQLLSGSPDEWKENLDSLMHDWWETNAKKLVTHNPDKELLPKAVQKTVEMWLRADDFVSKLKTIQRVPSVYFGSSGSSMRELRKDFLVNLRSAQENLTGTVQKMLEFPSHQPVHFVFNNDGDTAVRPLQVRSLETLIGYLVLIKAYYASLDTLVNGDGPIVIKRDSEGEVTFDEESLDQNYFLDPLSGTLFTVGDRAHSHYLSLRLAFLSSMWHLAEIMKLSNVLAIKKLTSLTGQKCAFLPERPFRLVEGLTLLK